MPDRLLDSDAILRLLTEVADELEATGTAVAEEVVVVGGALLALSGMREATRDVDTVRPVGKDLEAAVARVAARQGLAPAWLNDRARPYLPATFRVADCAVVLQRPGLVVYAAPFDQVFLMKVSAGRAVDVDDLPRLWPRCSFPSPEVAAAAYRAAYPHEEPDPHLADWIASVI